jgi:hypothetical protein
MLNLLLARMTDRKVIRNTKKIFQVDKIIDVKTRSCKYVGNNTEDKTHLQVKFTSTDEKGTICVSVLLDRYVDILY